MTHNEIIEALALDIDKDLIKYMKNNRSVHRPHPRSIYKLCEQSNTRIDEGEG